MMQKFHSMVTGVLLSVLVLGCRQSAPESSPAAQEKARAEIAAALAKLAPADRKLAQTQQKCPIADEPLGSMGTPVKIELNSQIVFLCCASCEDRARATPEATLARVKSLVGAGEMK